MLHADDEAGDSAPAEAHMHGVEVPHSRDVVADRHNGEEGPHTVPVGHHTGGGGRHTAAALQMVERNPSTAGSTRRRQLTHQRVLRPLLALFSCSPSFGPERVKS